MPAPTLYGQAETTAVVDVTKVSSVVTLDLSRGGAFRWSGSDATGTVTVTATNVPVGSTSSPALVEWRLFLDAHSTAPTVTWTGVTAGRWIGGSAPTIGNSEDWWIRFWTLDGGTTIYAQALK